MFRDGRSRELPSGDPPASLVHFIRSARNQWTNLNSSTRRTGLAKYEDLLVANLSLIERLVGSACRFQCFTPEDVEDFSSWVKLKLVQDNYAILARFEGRCALSTYLAIVIQHFLTDYRNRLWGKWRPSAHSERLGPLAVRIEMLVSREQRTPDEAFLMLNASGASLSRAEFDEIVRGIPERRPRLRAVDVADVEGELSVPPADTEAAAERDDRSATAATITSSLRTGIASLASEDITLLRLHFDAGLSVAEIARSLKLEQKPLYRRIKKICESLRDGLQTAGIGREHAEDIIGQPDVLLDFGLRNGGISTARPSSSPEAGASAKDRVST